MKTYRTFAGIAALAIAAFATITIMKNSSETPQEDGFIGRSDIKVENGHMTPEVLLAFGRLSDPQVSPDGEHLLYGVSYTSVEDNRSVRNLYICNIDGSDEQLLTQSGKSISNARWSADGKQIAFLKGGQIWTAEIGMKKGKWSLGEMRQVSDVPAGVGEFKLSPDQHKVMYISYVKSHVDQPKDKYADLGKATAYTTDDLMYRHWDHTVIEIPHTFVADFCFDVEDAITLENSTDILANENELYELPTEPFGGLEQLDWSPDGRHIAYSCRKLVGKKYAFSTNTEIYIYNVENGECSVIDMKGGYDTDPVWSPDGSKIAWISMERDGYEADKQRLMMAYVNWTKGSPMIWGITDVTEKFKYNAAGPVWSADSKDIYFHSLVEGLQGMFIAKGPDFDVPAGARIKPAPWQIERITGENEWYDFGSPFHIAENEDGSKT